MTMSLKQPIGSDAPRLPRDLIAGSLGAVVGLGVYIAQIAFYFRHVNDDAFITFRYSRFLASGLGPYFNVGEHVEGYTNFLHMLLMAVVYAVRGEATVPIAAKIVGVLAGAAALFAVYKTCRILVRQSSNLATYGNVVGGLAVCLIAVVPGFAVNSTSGLETTTLAFLVTAGVLHGLRGRIEGRWMGAGFLWAAAAWTRPEGVAIFAVYWIAQGATAVIGRARSATDGFPADRGLAKQMALDAAVVVVAVAAHLIFRYVAYDGELLPNTYYAKSEGFWGTTAWDYVRGGALAPFFGVLGLLLGVAGWWRSGLIRVGLPVVAVALFGAFLPFVVGGDWMPGWRFSVPFLPLLGVTVAVGWVRILAAAFRDRPRVTIVVAVVLVVTSALLYDDERRELADHLQLRADGYATGHQALATWIHEEAAEPGASVAILDIGIVGYYNPEQRILDISGLTDRHIARSPGPLMKKEYDPAYVLDQTPEIIVLVISALGDPREPLRPDARFGTWIAAETRIYNHPEFVAHYRRTREALPGSAPTEWLAARFGAERVFEHAHPDQHYFLAAYRRLPEALIP